MSKWEGHQWDRSINAVEYRGFTGAVFGRPTFNGAAALCCGMLIGESRKLVTIKALFFLQRPLIFCYLILVRSIYAKTCCGF